MKCEPTHIGGYDEKRIFRHALRNGFKHIWPRSLTALVIGLLLQAGLVVAQNLVTNPGFETGNTSGWNTMGSCTLTVESSQVNSNNYACEVSGRTATWNGIAQSLLGKLQSGQTYNVSAWVRLVSSGNQTVYVTVAETVGGNTTYIQAATGTATATVWTKISGQYTYNPSGTDSGLTFYVELPNSSTASYYIDDVNFSGQTIVTNPPTNGESTVDWNNVHQRIDGFGASSAWNGNWNTAEADLLFSTNNNISYQGGTYNGVGLSLLRNHIAYTNSTDPSAVPTTVETSIMQMAQARGARVWSSPWTPGAGFKSVNDIYDSNTATGNGINGGSFLGGDATNKAYASQLANYVASMKANYNVDIYAISIQNEPDANVTGYEACQWTNTYIRDFVTNLYNALVAKGMGSTKIMLPESQNWTDPKNLAGPSLNDPAVAADVGIVANHDYVRDNSVGDQTVPAAKSTPSGQAVWETEVALLSGSDSSIANGVYWARRIYQYMTQAQANAYHYWWLVGYGSGNEGLLDTSAAPTKRLFAFGQYSRFVRPNFYRINATSSQPSVLISAYRATNSAAFAIVVVNTNVASDVTQTFSLTNFTAASVTPWITSASLSLAPQTPVNVTNASFTYDLPAMSIVTFVGQGIVGQVNTPPTIEAVPNQTANAGVTLLVTNTASDSDVPAQTLTFSPANTFPAGATVGSNGLFSWRPLVSQANTTNLIKIQVTDSGSPPLSATNSFAVMVNAVTNPVISSLSFIPGQLNMTVNGPQGPDYTLWTSTNLLDWQAVFTTNSPTLPYTFSDTNLTGPAGFYRFQIGP